MRPPAPGETKACNICGAPRRVIGYGRPMMAGGAPSEYLAACPNHDDDRHRVVRARWAARRSA